MSFSLDLNQDFREFIELLKKHDVRYLVTGGFAVALYGYPRYTGDIDFWVGSAYANGERLVKALVEFGLASFNLTPEDFASPDMILQIGFPPNRIDLITSIDGVEFDLAYSNKKSIDSGGMLIDFISLSDLKKNKAASGRPKDLNDLKNLQND